MSSRDPVFAEGTDVLLSPERELPPAEPISRRPASPVRDVAHSVGSAVGVAVNNVRQLPERLQDVKARLIVIRGRAREDARERALEFKDKAGDTVAYARVRANRIAREYPLGVVAAAAGFGFLIGMMLRIWRDHD